jgi:hypothetical protein
MTVEQAVARLQEQEADLLPFINAASGRVQIIRRLEDGVSELIDPQPA